MSFEGVFVRQGKGDFCLGYGLKQGNRNWGTFLVNKGHDNNWINYVNIQNMGHDASIKSYKSEMLQIELDYLHDFLEKAIYHLHHESVENVMHELWYSYRFSGCPFFITEIKGFAAKCRSLLKSAEKICTNHVMHENIVDSLMAMQFHVGQLKPEGIFDLLYTEIISAGSHASTPESVISTASGDSANAISGFVNKKLRETKCGKKEKPECAKKLHLK